MRRYTFVVNFTLYTTYSDPPQEQALRKKPKLESIAQSFSSKRPHTNQITSVPDLEQSRTKFMMVHEIVQSYYCR